MVGRVLDCNFIFHPSCDVKSVLSFTKIHRPKIRVKVRKLQSQCKSENGNRLKKPGC